MVDALGEKRVGDIRLDAHPESFQPEGLGSRIFVNVPEAGHIAVLDRIRQIVVATRPVDGASGNFPLALDERSHRLFIGCRNPPELIFGRPRSGGEGIQFSSPNSKGERVRSCEGDCGGWLRSWGTLE